MGQAVAQWLRPLKAYNRTVLHVISFVWRLLPVHISTLCCQRQGAFLEPSKICAQLIIHAFVDFQVYSN
jgi:hypothetical protein